MLPPRVDMSHFEADPDLVTAPANVCAVCEGSGYVRFDVDYGHADFGKARSCPACAGADVALMQRIWTVSGLLEDDPAAPTLASFMTTHDAQAGRMWEAGLAFVANPRGWLIITGLGRGRDDREGGRWGAGKSHLAEAMARALIARNVPALLMTADALFAFLGCVWRAEDDDVDYDRRMAWVIGLPVLLIDELNVEGKSDAIWRRRRELLDARYQAALRGRGGATVLISNDRPAAWQDPAIASRALDSRFVQVEAAAVDYRQVER